MLEIAIIFADSRRDAGYKGQVAASFCFQNKKIQGMVQWKKLNTSIYFFAPSVSPNLNYFFTLPYSQMYFFVFFLVFEVSWASPFPS